MNIRLFRVLASAALMLVLSIGCLPPPQWQAPPRDISERASRAVSFTPEVGQGVIYVYPGLKKMVLGRLQIFIDGVECGYTTGATYVRIVVPPGLREVRTAGYFKGFR